MERCLFNLSVVLEKKTTREDPASLVTDLQLLSLGLETLVELYVELYVEIIIVPQRETL